MILKKILVVDDDRFFRQILKDSLQDRYEVIEANCGEESVSLAAEIHPDLIILDIVMPKISGIEICRKLKEAEETKRTPVILISSCTQKEDIIRGLQAGADDYLTKPVYPPEMLARIDAHLRSKSYYTDLEHRDMQMLLELSDSISVMRNPIKILQMIVEKISDVVSVARCSIVSISGEDEIFVKASSDLMVSREIRLELNRYPEIRKALETRRAVVVNDIKHDPLMTPVRQHVEDLELNSIIVVPIIKKESVIGTLFLRTATMLKDGISERVYKLCHLVANIAANALENAMLFESMENAKNLLEEMAIRDGLTRLYTHRHFYDRLEEEFSRSVRYHEPLSLLFLDIDNFKKINDNHGHTRGDEVLRQIGRMIRELLRESDIPARYGGEEFAILLPNTQPEGAMEMARRLAMIIREFRFAGLKDDQITISVGVATFLGTNLESFNQLVHLADQAMYKAKAEGKNRIVSATGAIDFEKS